MPSRQQFSLFVLEVLKDWTDPTQKKTRTLHHHGCGKFTVDGKILRLKVENAMRGTVRNSFNKLGTPSTVRTVLLVFSSNSLGCCL